MAAPYAALLPGDDVDVDGEPVMNEAHTHKTKKLDFAVLASTPIGIPAGSEQDAFAKKLTAMDKRLLFKERAYRAQLLTLKSGLMDKLLTDCVRVTPLLQGTAP